MTGGEGIRVAVAGATGAVGREMLRLLAAATFPIAEVRALASERSVGKELPFRNATVVVEQLRDEAFEGIDLALFSAGADRSLRFAPAAVERGGVVVDNSSAFRRAPDVPLVVPEVNGEACQAHRGIIANPNCSTIQMVLPLKALRDGIGLLRVVVATFQSASGAGQAGIDELIGGTRELLDGREPRAQIFAHPLPFEALPHIGSFDPSGYTSEEIKMTFETRKILELPRLEVSATCVRVPVVRGHSEAVTVDLRRPAAAEEVQRLMADMPGLVVRDDPTQGQYPLARQAVGRNETFVGRIRQDLDRPATVHFWVVSDNLLKGAAWNAVQIAELLVARGWLTRKTTGLSAAGHRG